MYVCSTYALFVFERIKMIADDFLSFFETKFNTSPYLSF